MGRRRRRVVRIAKKQLPKIFVCPKCGEEAVRVTMLRPANSGFIICGSCGAHDIFRLSPAMEEVDVYCMFTDSHYQQSAYPVQVTVEPVEQIPPPEHEMKEEKEEEPFGIEEAEERVLCDHRARTVVQVFVGMKGDVKSVLYACSNCGKRIREGV